MLICNHGYGNILSVQYFCQSMNVFSFFEVLFSQATTSSGFDPRIWFSFPLFFSSSLTGPQFRWATFPVYKSPVKSLLCLSLIDSQSREQATSLHGKLLRNKTNSRHEGQDWEQQQHLLRMEPSDSLRLWQEHLQSHPDHSGDHEDQTQPGKEDDFSFNW